MGVASVWVGQGAGRVDMGAKKYFVLFLKIVPQNVFYAL